MPADRFAPFARTELHGLAIALFAAAGEGAITNAAEQLAHELAAEMRARGMTDIQGPFMHEWRDADDWLAGVLSF